MTQFKLTLETSILTSTKDIPRYVNNIIEATLENEFDKLQHHREASV